MVSDTLSFLIALRVSKIPRGSFPRKAGGGFTLPPIGTLDTMRIQGFTHKDQTLFSIILLCLNYLLDFK
jgi:hypothetical protein